MELPTMLIEENNFHNAWAKAVQKVLKQGVDITIGGADQRKPIIDSCALVSLNGNAINQIEAREIHPQYPFKSVDEYCKEFTIEFLEEYQDREKENKFAYLYFERFAAYPRHMGYMARTLNQIIALKKQLKSQIDVDITSNRSQMITWIAEDDLYTTFPPCLQRIQIRYIPENKVDVHLTWRSRDLYTAWQSNVIAIIDMLKREVIAPNDCKIVRIIDYNDSLHIYKTDIGQAKEVKLLPVSPQEITRR